MKKMIVIMLTIALVVLSAACSGSKETPESGITEEIPQAETGDTYTDEEQKTDNNEEERGAIEMTLKINDEAVNVSWEDNGSVRALADLAAKGPITIDTSLYGGFEQVGGIGTTLPSNDIDITTAPGDIVLYSGSNIVVFFGSNSWAYTRLGHIEGKSRDELRDMLGGNNVVLTITSDI